MIHLILLLAIFGFLVWLILQIPMPTPFRNIILGVVCIVAVIWVLQALGLDTGFGNLRVR